MKKLYLICLITALVSCKKADTTDTSGNTTVRYDFSASVATTFTIVYDDEYGNATNTTVTATSWTKTISTNSAKGFKWALLSESTDGKVKTTGHLNIYINDNPVPKNSADFDSSVNPSVSINVVVFK